MRPALKSALIFAGIWIAIKMIFFGIGIFQDNLFVTGLINNLFLLSSISIGLYLEKKKEGFGSGTALTDIKHSMVAGAPYALIVSVFMFFYYDGINPAYLEDKKTELNDALYQNLQRKTWVEDTLIPQNKELEVLSQEEIYNKIKKSNDGIYSANTILLISLLGLIVLSLTYAIFITIIFRKILLRDYYK